MRPSAASQHHIPDLPETALSNPYMAGWDYRSPIWDTGGTARATMPQWVMWMSLSAPWVLRRPRGQVPPVAAALPRAPRQAPDTRLRPENVRQGQLVRTRPENGGAGEPRWRRQSHAGAGKATFPHVSAAKQGTPACSIGTAVESQHAASPHHPPNIGRKRTFLLRQEGTFLLTPRQIGTHGRLCSPLGP